MYPWFHPIVELRALEGTAQGVGRCRTGPSAGHKMPKKRRKSLCTQSDGNQCTIKFDRERVCGSESELFRASFLDSHPAAAEMSDGTG